MRWTLTGVFCCAFVLGILMSLLVRALGLKWHSLPRVWRYGAYAEPQVVGGGAAMLPATALPILLVCLAAALVDWNPSLLPAAEPIEQAIRAASRSFPALATALLGGAAIAVLGLWDDIEGLKPTVKFIGILALAGATATVPQVRIVPLAGSPLIRAGLAVLWVALLTYCFSLFADTEGQCVLVAFLSGGALLVLALQTDRGAAAALLLAFSGGALGLLPFNFPRASILPGKSGAMFAGYVLAVSTGLAAPPSGKGIGPAFPLVVALTVFAVPLWDALSMGLARLSASGDERRPGNLTTRLVRIGLSERLALLAIGLLVAATAGGATIPYGGPIWRAMVPLVQAGAIGAVVILLAVATRKTEGSSATD